MKPFLLLQLRPEDAAADGEYEAFLKAGNLKKDKVQRVRMEQQDLPSIDIETFSAVIVGGGPSCVSSKNKSPTQLRFESQLKPLMNVIIKKDFPFFGACYGFSLLASHLGGRVSTEKYSEPVAATTIKLSAAAAEDPLTNDLPTTFKAFGGHKEACQVLPSESVLLAGSSSCPVQMIRFKTNIYGTQFHPELDSEGISLRIRIYAHAGYFPPDQADELIANAMKETVAIPEKIFEKFVVRYSALQK